MSFQIIKNDITKVKADAIVNTSNLKPTYGGVSVTPASKLNAKYIIHTAEPVWEGGDKGEFDILRNCYENSLNMAKELKCKSIAFPLIATEVYNFPKDKALQIAMSVIQAFLAENNMKVILVVLDKQAFKLSGDLIDNIREYVDDCLNNGPDLEMPLPMAIEARPKKKIKIDDLIAASDKTFQEKLFEIIDERGLTGPQVYKNYVTKQVFSKIQSNKDYHPNKYTAIALCLSLHLDVDQTQDLIGRAGWALSPSSKADIVVRGCILNQEFNVVRINCILFDFDCPELEKIK